MLTCAAHVQPSYPQRIQGNEEESWKREARGKHEEQPGLLRLALNGGLRKNKPAFVNTNSHGETFDDGSF